MVFQLLVQGIETCTGFDVFAGIGSQRAQNLVAIEEQQDDRKHNGQHDQCPLVSVRQWHLDQPFVRRVLEIEKPT